RLHLRTSRVHTSHCVQAWHLFEYSNWRLYFFPLTNNTGSRNCEFEFTIGSQISPISAPHSMSAACDHHSSRSGSVIISTVSCDKTEAVESTRSPFGVGVATWHPATF